MEHDILYNKYKFNNIPLGANILITSDHKKLYYYKNAHKIYIHEIDSIPLNNKLIHINILSMREKNDTIVSLYINVNDSILSDCMGNPINFVKQNKLILLAQKCHKDIFFQYNSKMTTDLKNTYSDHKGIYFNMDKINMHNYILDNDNLKWMVDCEKNKQDKFYSYGKFILRFGKNLIDISKEEIIADELLNKETAFIRGGILINNDGDNWAYDCINLAKFSHIPTEITNKFFKTMATLVICNRSMCNGWKMKIKTINPSSKCIVIDNKHDHKDISYGDIISSDYIIINVKYISGNVYKKILAYDNEMCSNNLEGIQKEYMESNNNAIKCTNPIFSFFYWNRIIIDNDVSLNMFQNKNLRNELFKYNGYFKWIQLCKFPSNHSHILLLIRYLINFPNGNFPLYNENNELVNIGNNIRTNTIKVTHNIKINESLIRANMHDFDKKIYNFCIENSHDKNNNEFIKILIDCIGQLSANWLPYKQICKSINKYTKHEIRKLELQLRKDIDNTELQIKLNAYKKRITLFEVNVSAQCGICCESNHLDDIVISTCCHNFCINCALNIIKYTSVCPYCRENINIHTMYHIKTNSNALGSKLQQLVTHIKYVKKDNMSRYIILCKYPNILKYISNGLKENNIKNERLSGLYSEKINKINKFDNNKNGIIIMLFSDISIIDNIKQVNGIIFYDTPGTNDILSKSKLYNSEMCNKNYSLNVYYLVYNNTTESQIIKFEKSIQ